MLDSGNFDYRERVDKSDGRIEPFLPNGSFQVFKRLFDVALALALMPLLAILAVIIAALNPWLNQGKLFFVQKRMGKDCLPFYAIKFRSMTEVTEITRSADCPLEVDRITRLGGFLRKARIDELPQIINVLRGEMSFIGPRPDYFEHAQKFVDTVPAYAERHKVTPGISGLAQTELGYVEGSDATASKVRADLYYIEHQSFGLEWWIIRRTFSVILNRAGA